MFLIQYWGGPTTYSRAARAPAAADAARAVRDRRRRARRLAAPHARRARHARPAAGLRADALGLPGLGRRLAAQHARAEPLAPGWAQWTRVPKRLQRRPWWAVGRLLPDLSAQLRRRQRRRHRRPDRRRASGSTTSSSSASTRCGSRRSTARRWPTAATTSPTRATSTRCSARSPTSTRCWPQAHERGHQGHDRHRPEPLLERAPVVPGGARRRPGRARAGPVHHPPGPRPRRRRAAEQLAVGVRRPGVDAAARRRVVPAPVRARAARPELGQPGGARRVRADRAVLARPRRRRVPGRRRPLAWPRSRACPTWTCRSSSTSTAWPRCRSLARHPLGPRRRCTTTTADAPGARLLPRRPDGGRRGVGRRRRAAGALRPPGRAQPDLQLRTRRGHAGPPRTSARRSSDSLAAMAGVGAPCTWVLANHDVDRPATRYGGGARGRARGPAPRRWCSCRCRARPTSTTATSSGCRTSTCPTRRCRTRPGSSSGHTERGRDGERVPLPWSGDRAAVRLHARRRTPGCRCPPYWAPLTVAAQAADPASTLSAVPGDAAAAAHAARAADRRDRAARRAARLPGLPARGVDGVAQRRRRRGADAGRRARARLRAGRRRAAAGHRRVGTQLTSSITERRSMRFGATTSGR